MHKKTNIYEGILKKITKINTYISKKIIEELCLNNNIINIAIQCEYYYLRLKILISKYQLIKKYINNLIYTEIF